MHEIKRISINVQGVVQGVGFRPFVYNLARELNLKGWVNNTPLGVDLEIEGEPESLEHFARRLIDDAPPLALIEETSFQHLEPANYTDFIIKESGSGQEKFTLISPDVATCPDCLAELKDTADRRYRYPFINCTNCGPRYTIIQDVPYDRPYTTMAEFPMCPDCLKEYQDPQNRRFHAQPNACPVCGPKVTLLDSQGVPLQVADPLAAAAGLLRQGKILAVKGLGGYHLACDALNEETVSRLRNSKNREAKPFALMIPELAKGKLYCHVSKEEEAVLTGNRRPIVLLRKKTDSPVAEAVAPNNRYLGVMLPYTPLHYLLFADGPEVLVMTSGNSSGEAIEYLDGEALENLAGIADYILTHNRDIHIRADDSVLRVFRGQEMMLRRSRGYVPLPVKLPFKAEGILATGGELKNNLCLTKDNMAFMSQYIGDLESLSNILAFEQAVGHLQRMFNISPSVVAYDLHPGYTSSNYALDLPGLIKVPVQHHHAHIASCMAENGLVEDVIGVAFDGTGYGTDGTIWGGEFFTGSYQGFTRWAHLAQVPIAGGDAAVKQPWRMAVSHLIALKGPEVTKLPLPAFAGLAPEELRMVANMVTNRSKLLTSSAGRLFDAVAALLGVRQEISYEGQAAIELEQLAIEEYDGRSYGFTLKQGERPWKICLDAMFNEMVEELLQNRPVQVMASRFHRTVVEFIAATCCQIRRETGLRKVALSGGVFQNIIITGQTVSRLEMEGFDVYTHSKVPANDGGIALGQAAVAAMAMRERSVC